MKILYLGNSITLHGINHDIGWHWEWGMAASAEEKDYVHCLNRMIEEKEQVSVEYKVRNIADFEREPETYNLENLAELRDWSPDVLILRICENTPEEKVDAFG
ncbi:MAG: SGNH/GDSL hydrolase family protein, partial [Clostridia bacterium]|nr:SGNH/GDSL hydrolase family protein [Clostridia bacterium]